MRETCPAIIRCLSICRGNVAWWSAAGKSPTRKVRGLLDAEALVVVVSPALCDALATMAGQGLITYQARPFRADDVLGCTLVIGATDQVEVNAAVCKAARAHDVWVNIVDTPEACDFIAPPLCGVVHSKSPSRLAGTARRWPNGFACNSKRPTAPNMAGC